MTPTQLQSTYAYNLTTHNMVYSVKRGRGIPFPAGTTTQLILSDGTERKA